MPSLHHTLEQILAKLRKEARRKACGPILSPCRRGSGGRRAVKTHGNSLCDTTAFSGSSLVPFTLSYTKQNLQNVFQPLAACLVVRGHRVQKPLL